MTFDLSLAVLYEDVLFFSCRAFFFCELFFFFSVVLVKVYNCSQPIEMFVGQCVCLCTHMVNKLTMCTFHQWSCLLRSTNSIEAFTRRFGS